MKQPLLLDSSGCSEIGSSLSWCGLFSKKRPLAPRDEPRIVPIGLLMCTASEEHPFIYTANVITSTRYTVLNFLPKSLLEQFRRLANVYFLVIGIIASIGYYSSAYTSAVEPAGILVPMCIVVLISVIKDGIEDTKRANLDRKINSRPCNRIEVREPHSTAESGFGRIGQLVTSTWDELQVGDCILIQDNDEIPADCAVLACGGVQGDLCYVDTAAIDGETNLKLKSPALAGLQAPMDKCDIKLEMDKMEITQLPKFSHASFTVEPPNGSIHRFNGKLEVSLPTFKPQCITLQERNLLLRGSVLRATEWSIAVVVYTGADTKLSLNSKKTPSKLSSIDRIVNKTLLVAILTMIAVCLLSMIFGASWVAHHKNTKYLCLQKSDLASEYPNGGGCESDYQNSGLSFFTFATLYNNFVCISMYVSLEMVYLCQAYFVSNDLNIYDASTDTPAECHSSGSSADLGQVQYILSDKTGTLTKNCMVVQNFSIGNSVYGELLLAVEEESDQFAEDRDTAEQPPKSSLSSTSSSFPISRPFSEVMSWRQADSSGKKPKPESALEDELKEEFIRVLAYCHTAMLMPDKKGQVEINNAEDLEKCVEAESPDEAALILAIAQECGVLLVQKSEGQVQTMIVPVSQSPTLQGTFANVIAERESVEILAVNEFDSTRKMMSVLVRFPELVSSSGSKGRLMLLCKGADSSMAAACDPESNPYTAACNRHIDAFASTGLRTLVAGSKEVSAEDAEAWLLQYNEACNDIAYREEQLSLCARQIEKGLRLLGAIGIEDELQDGVPEAIQVLHAAGLNVWMITGDKAETAIAIGKKSKLIDTSRDYVERILTLSGPALHKRIQEVFIKVFGPNSERKSIASFLSFSEEYKNTMTDRITGDEQGAASSGLKSKEMVLIIDGMSLEGIWAEPDLKDMFVDIIRDVNTVIASRVSPLQKATLVRMIKTGPGNPITLAIGDGANDVGMIHESRVGVGISGKEGRHAANSSDFAIGQFRFIVQLLFYHGRFNYIRCSKLVLYSFFKNLLLVGVLFYYCFYSGFSGTIPINSFVFTGYNFYLGLPILAVGAMDWDVPRHDVLKFPYLAYATGRKGEMLNMMNMTRWCLFAFIQGLLLFVLTVPFYSGTIKATSSNYGFFDLNIYGTGLDNVSDGQMYGMSPEGFMIYTVAVVAMQYKVVAMAVTPNYLFWFVWVLSFIGYFLFVYVFGLFPSLNFFNTVPFAMSQPNFWLALLLVPLLLVLSDSCFDNVWTFFAPDSRDQLVAKLADLS